MENEWIPAFDENNPSPTPSDTPAEKSWIPAFDSQDEKSSIKHPSELDVRKQRAQRQDEMTARLDFLASKNGEETVVGGHKLSDIRSAIQSGAFYNAPEDVVNKADEEIFAEYEKRRKEIGITDGTAGSLDRGLKQTAGMIIQAKHAVTGAEDEDSKSYLQAVSRNNQLEALRNPKKIAGLSEVRYNELKGVTDALGLGWDMILENAPNALLAIAAAYTVGRAAPALGAGTIATKILTSAAAGAAGLAQNLGEAVGDQVDEGLDLNRGLAVGQGALYTVLDSVTGGEVSAARRMLRGIVDPELKLVKKGLLTTAGKAIKEIGKDSLLEGTTETAQSGIIGRGRRLIQTGSPLANGETVKDALLAQADEWYGGFAAGAGMGGASTAFKYNSDRKLIKQSNVILDKYVDDASVKAMPIEDRVLVGMNLNGMEREAYLNSEIAKSTDEDGKQKLQSELKDVQRGRAEAIDAMGDDAKKVASAYEGMFATEGMGEIPATVPATFSMQRALASVQEEMAVGQDGIEVKTGRKNYLDPETGILVVEDKDGNMSVTNDQNGMRMPSDADNIFEVQDFDGNRKQTLNAAMLFARELSRFNYYRSEKNADQIAFIGTIANKLSPGTKVALHDSILESEQSGMMDSLINNGGRPIYDKESETLHVLTGALKNPVEARGMIEDAIKNPFKATQQSASEAGSGQPRAQQPAGTVQPAPGDELAQAEAEIAREEAAAQPGLIAVLPPKDETGAIAEQNQDVPQSPVFLQAPTKAERVDAELAKPQDDLLFPFEADRNANADDETDFRSRLYRKYPVETVQTESLIPNDPRIAQFKKDAHHATGVVAGNELKGQPLGLQFPPIIVMRFKDGTESVVTGRHRLDLAKRNGWEGIPAYVLNESDGWTAEEAQIVDAMSNILDEKGSIYDYVSFFNKTADALDPGEIESLRSRPKGNAAWSLTIGASQDLIAAIDWADDGSGISPEQAAAIAQAAPVGIATSAASVQRLSIEKAKFGMKPNLLYGYAQSLLRHAELLQANPVESMSQQDLFKDTEWATQNIEADAEKESKAILGKVQHYTRLRAVLSSAIQKPQSLVLTAEQARELGIKDRNDKRQLYAAREKADEMAKAWASSTISIEMINQARAEAGLVPMGEVSETTKAGDAPVITPAPEKPKPADEAILSQETPKEQAAAVAKAKKKTEDREKLKAGVDNPIVGGDSSSLTQQTDMFSEQVPTSTPLFDKKPTLNDVKSPLENLSTADQARAAELLAKLKALKTRMNSVGIDPETLAVGIELTGLYVKGGIKTFKQFAAAMKTALGETWDSLKFEIKQFWDSAANQYPDIDEVSREESRKIIAELDAQDPEVPDSNAELDAAIKDADARSERVTKANKAIALMMAEIKSEKGLTRGRANQIMSDVFGGGEASGAFSSKDTTDFAEAAVNKMVLNGELNISPKNDVETARWNVTEIEKIFGKIPTQSTRTKEMVKMQQFSTPPTFGYVANWVANTNDLDVVLEPSAGIGGLAVFPKRDGAMVIANELSERRSELIEYVGAADKLYNENAEHLSAILEPKIKSGEIQRPTLVIMNPPFTAAALHDKNSSTVGARHVQEALNLLADGGRLVAIVGNGMANDRPAFKKWWAEIGSKYTVRANIGVNGSEYRKYGTTFDNQLIVIDKVKPTGQTTPVYGKVDSVKDLPALLKEVRNGRPELTPAESSGTQEVDGTGTDSIRGANESSTVYPPVDGVRDSSVQRDTPRGERSGNASGIRRLQRPGESTGTRKAGVGNVGAGKSTLTGGSGNERTDGNSSVGDGISLPGHSSAVLADETNAVPKIVGDDTFTAYQPEVKIEGAHPHPMKLVQSSALGSVSSPKTDYTPRLPKGTIENGVLSDAQLVQVVYAGQSFKNMTPEGTRMGYFIGDGTGVGKGREIAGIILDNMLNGREKAVWVSKNIELVNDANRDFEAFGVKNILHSMEKNNGKILDGQKKGVAFIPYSSLKQDLIGIDKNGNLEYKTGQRVKSRIEQLVNWLGKDFDGVIAFDEVHLAGNVLSIKGQRGTSKPSQTALAVVALQRALPNARILYVSATGATKIENLAFGDRLGIWGPGTPFPTKHDFISQISAGGMSALEIVSRDLKNLGRYNARTLSFEGVRHERITHEMTVRDTAKYNEMGNAWQLVMKQIREILAQTDGAKCGETSRSAMSSFFGSQQRFFNQLLTAMMMPSIIAKAKERVAAGESVVFQITNTNEASQAREINKLRGSVAEEDFNADDVDLSSKSIIVDYVKKINVNRHEMSTDENGNEVWKPALDSQGNPITDPQAERMRDELVFKLNNMVMPQNPLESIMDAFGPHKVAEITGRSKRIVPKVDESGDYTTVLESRTKEMSAREAREFNDGKRQVLVFSDAGGTGRSYHAGKDFKNQQIRNHFLIQAGWKADAAMQGFGRTHRSGQVQPPVYWVCSTNVNGHKRFISAIAKRLNQLGSLTAGDRDTAGSGIMEASDNLENSYSETAVDLLFKRKFSANRAEFDEICASLGFVTMRGENPLVDKDIGAIIEENIPNVAKFLNRILMLNIGPQNDLFDEFEQIMQENIDFAKQKGTFDRGLQTLNAESIKMLKDELLYTHPDSGAKTRLLTLEVGKKVHKNTFDAMDAVVSKKILPRYVQNKSSGKVYAIAEGSIRTNDKGEMAETFDRWGVTGPREIKEKTEVRTETGYRQPNYINLDKDTARRLWTQAYETAPDIKTEEQHYLTGAMLPIWDRLPITYPQIYRINPEGQDSLLGVLIPENLVGKVRQNLNAGTGETAKTPSSVYQAILQGQTFELANGYVIKRVKVNGEPRIEIKGLETYSQLRELRDYLNGFSEVINNVERAFIPVDTVEGVKSLEKLLKKSPIVENNENTGNQYYSYSDHGFRPADEVAREKILAWLGNAQAELKGKASVEIHESIVDLRETLGNDSILPNAEGVYSGRDGTAHIVVDSLPDLDRAKKVFAHEVIGHLAMEQYADMAAGVQMVLDMKGNGEKTITDLWDEVSASHPGLSETIHAKEVIALMAERGVENSAMDRIVNAFKAILRRLGIDVSFSERELRGMIASAARSLEKGEQGTNALSEIGDLYSTPETPLREPTGISKAYYTNEAEALGRDITIKKTPWTTPETIQSALNLLRDDPKYGAKLMERVKLSPRTPISKEDLAVLSVLKSRNTTAYNEAFDRMMEAKTTGNTDVISETTLLHEELLEDRDRIDMALLSAGSAAGSSLRFMQTLLKRDFSVESLRRQLIASQNGTPLTGDKAKIIEDIARRYKETNDRLNKRISELEEQIDSVDVKKSFEKITKEKRDVSPMESMARAKKAMRRVIFKNSGMVEDETLKSFVQRMAYLHVSTGVTKLDPVIDLVLKDVREVLPDLDIGAREVRDMLSNYGVVKLPSTDEVAQRLADLKSQALKVSAIEDVLRGIPPKRTGFQRGEMSAEARELTRTLNRMMKESGITTRDKETQLKSAMDSLKTRMRNRIDDLQKAISTGARIVKANPDALIYDDEATSLKERLETAKQAYDNVFPAEEISDADKLRRVLRYKDNAISRWEAKLAAARDGNFATTKATQKLETPETLERDARIQAMKDEFAKLQDQNNPELTDEAMEVRNYKRVLERNITRYQNRLANKDFLPKPKKDRNALIASHKDLYELFKAQEQAKADFNKQKELFKLKNRTNTEAAFSLLSWGHRFLRSWQVFADYSALLRQGGKAAYANPREALRAIMPMLKASVSEQEMFKIHNDIYNRQNATFYKKAGLYIAEFGPNASLSQLEEVFSGKLGEIVNQKTQEKIHKLANGKYNPMSAIDKVKEGSERAYITLLNVLRADVFDKLVDAAGGIERLTDSEMKALAKYVNIATGRGQFFDIKALEEQSNAMSIVLFAPRWMVSNFEWLAGTSLWGGSTATRKIIAKQYARSIVGFMAVHVITGALYSLLRDKDDEDKRTAAQKFSETINPLSAKFLKVKAGADGWIDLGAGALQPLVFISRMIMGKTTTAFGETKDKTRGEIAQRFMRGKLSPSTGIMVDFLTGKTFDYKTFSMANEFSDKFLPLSLSEVIGHWQNMNIPEASISSILSIFGAGVQNWAKEEYGDYAREFKSYSKQLAAAKTAKERDAILKLKPYLAYSAQIKNGESQLRKIAAAIKEREKLDLNTDSLRTEQSKIQMQVIKIMDENK